MRTRSVNRRGKRDDRGHAFTRFSARGIPGGNPADPKPPPSPLLRLARGAGTNNLLLPPTSKPLALRLRFDGDV